jgi:3D (Asp-Asp-Asp) domain-containing protein
MSKSLLGGGAATAVALFSASLIFYTPQTSIAEPLAYTVHEQQARPEAARKNAAPHAAAPAAEDASSDETADRPAARIGRTAPSGASQPFVATAYSLRGRTASGRTTARGIIAADRRLLPLGTRVRLEAGGYSGEYVVADTGGLVRGRKIDIWMPTSAEAMRFGRRTVKLTVLSYGGRRAEVRPAIKIRK